MASGNGGGFVFVRTSKLTRVHRRTSPRKFGNAYQSVRRAEAAEAVSAPLAPEMERSGISYFRAFLAFPSAEHGLSLEQVSPITPTAWISISIPGLAKFVTVISALPG
jgi:hypothetical protein